MLETLERLILLQIGAAAATREKIEEIVNRLIEQGRIEREEGRAVVEDIMSRARERSGGARSLIDASVQQGLRGAGVPNREAYEDLLFRVEQLEHRVRLLEGQPAPAAEPPTAEPPIPPTPSTSPPPPVGGVDATPQPPREEPDTPPGLQPGGR
jgi:polyhydroxyalkanoate synthesis regulator phasin